MSGYLDGLLAEHGLERRRVLENHDGFYLVAVSIGLLVAEEQSVRHSPIHPPVHCCDPVHAEVIGTKGSKRRSRLAKASRWVPELGPDGGRTLDDD